MERTYKPQDFFLNAKKYLLVLTKFFQMPKKINTLRMLINNSNDFYKRKNLNVFLA